MIKKIVLLLLVFGIFASSIPVDVKAAETDGCTAVLGTTQKIKHGKNKYYDPAYYLQVVLNVIKYVGVIACIGFSIVDFFKELLSEDKDGYKKVVNKSLKRLVYAVIIFVLPILVMQMLKLANIATDATCGIR